MRRVAARSVEVAPEAPPEDDQDLEAGQPHNEPGLRRILLLAKPEWAWFALGILLLFGSLVPMLAMPLFFGQVLNYAAEAGGNMTPEERKAAINRTILELLTVIFFSMGCTVGRAFIFNTGGERVVARLRVQLFRAIICQEIAMFDRRNTGELLSRLSADTTSLQDVATTNISMFIRGAVQVLASCALMFYTSWKLALLIVVVVPCTVVLISVYSRLLKRLSTAYSDALGKSSDIAQQSVSNIRTVRSFAAEEIESKRYEASVGNPDEAVDALLCWYPRTPSSYKTGVQRALAGSFFQGFVGFLGFGSIALVIWFGAYEVVDQQLSFGNLLSFILYSVQIGGSLGMMSSLMVSLFKAKGAAKRAFQLIDREPRVPVKGGVVPEEMEGTICFDNVSFSYPTRPDVMVLKDFSLEIPKNRTVAFVGSSGAGKSTVLSLIQRFYDVTGGQILIDGAPLVTLDPSWVRHHFAYVQQEPVLFSGTINENISYGHAVRVQSITHLPEQHDLEKVAHDAFAHNFIVGFPQGYNTIVGERGVRLSGGQKQRLAIARALLMDPRVLLLDEATSALDAESEAYVAEAITKAMEGRTTLIVAHRLSTVLNASQIVFMDHGTIADMGSHAHLFATCQKYQELVRRQLMDTSSAGSFKDGGADADQTESGGPDGSAPGGESGQRGTSKDGADDPLKRPLISTN